MGYCPFPALGRDLGTVSQKAGPKACVRGRKPGAWPSVRERHGQGSAVSRHTFWCHDLVWQNWCRDTLFGVMTWFDKIGVATHFLVSRHGWPSWCRDALLVSQHGRGRMS